MVEGAKPGQIAPPPLEIDEIPDYFLYPDALQNFIYTLSADHQIAKLGL